MFKDLKALQANATEQMEQIKVERVKQMEMAAQIVEALTDMKGLLTEVRDLLKGEK